MPVKDYRVDFLTKLTNPDYAALYLKTALNKTLKDGNWEAFRLALTDVIEARQTAQGDFSRADIPEEPSQQTLPEDAGPTLETLLIELSTASLTIDFKPV